MAFGGDIIGASPRRHFSTSYALKDEPKLLIGASGSTSSHWRSQSTLQGRAEVPDWCFGTLFDVL
jgi:hypothetical protein